MGFDGESDTTTDMEESDIRFEAECGTNPNEDMDESDDPGEPDSTYVLSAKESFMSDREQVSLQKERKFIVFEGCLLELVQVCRTCLAPCRNAIVVQGTQVRITSTCAQNHVERWWSQPQVSGKAAGNILICAEILFSGAPVATTLRLLKSINVATVSERTFRYYQQAYLLPAVKQVYKRHNSELLEGLQGKTVDLAGDGHCDPPAFSAKHWTYSFHEASTKKVIHIEQVRVGEVRFTNQNKKPTLRHTPLYLE
ncbi:uncharacterized protein LOC115329042 [Ixodes scapularis]|uniref:uncharacterized protein LOC115329042 n=1 Tax=Ixodes scapularis TaxID=6945 RepID=UPI001C39355A|nr:uncharacterized protein LOC115329042 [Ixodes scapularis]